jgi:PKD repeat protein
MDQKSNQLESIFRAACDNQKLAPSPGVLRKLRMQLAVSDYLSFNPRKFSFVYTLLILAGIGSVILLTRSPKTEKSSSSGEQTQVTPKQQINRNESKPSTEVVNGLEKSNEGSRVKASGTLLKAMFTANSTKGCAPLTIRFNDKSMGGSTYLWNFGNGVKSVEKSPIYTFTQPGHYTAMLTIEDREGQKNSFTQEIEVLEKPVANFEIDIDNSEIRNKKLVLKNNSTLANNYSWDFGDGYQISGSKAQHSYADYGQYRINLIAKAENGCSDTSFILSRFIEKDYELSFPLNFRPDPTERNDGYYGQASTLASIFYPKNFGANKYELNIFAPNGLKVFSTNTITQGWSGYIGARIAPAGTYSWEAVGIYPNGKPFNLHGSVQVIVQDYE